MIKTQIENKLQQAFSPTHLEVINESYMHHVLRVLRAILRLLLSVRYLKGKDCLVVIVQ